MNRKTLYPIARSLALLALATGFAACASGTMRVEGRVFSHPDPGKYDSTIWMDPGATPLTEQSIDLNGVKIKASYKGSSGVETAYASSDPDGSFELSMPLERSPTEKDHVVTLEATKPGYRTAKGQFPYGSASITKTVVIFLRKE
jgi:hypothetical protein